MAYSLATTSIDNPVGHAGLKLDPNKARATERPIKIATPSVEMVLPLEQHAGAPAVPIVQAGDRVLIGQPIAKPGAHISAWLHSPVAGTVIAIEDRPSTFKAGAIASCIVIRNDESEERHGNSPVADYRSLSPGALCEHIALGGIVGLGGATFPTAAKLTRASPEQEIELIVNGVECEPFISCDDMLMRERADLVIAGAQIMMHALTANRAVISIEDDKPLAITAIQEALTRAADDRLHLAVLATEYPAGGERQLITAITQREVPSEGLPQDIGVVCQNVGTAAAVAKWVLEGEPLMSRVTTVTGAGVRDAMNLEVRIGTAIRDVIAQCGGYTDAARRLMSGGSMMGVGLPDDDLPVIKGTNCLLVTNESELLPRAAEVPCIRCGECSNACPVALLPQQLHWHACTQDLPALASLGLLDCIECGCCDYVCPSQIPLVERFREAKPGLIERLDAQSRASQYRERFEARSARLTALEAERRAKLEARRRVATRNLPRDQA